MPSIGELIRAELKSQERSVSWLARKLSCDRSSVYRLFQKQSIDTAVLWRISLLLHHNFFEDLACNFSAKKERIGYK